MLFSTIESKTHSIAFYGYFEKYIEGKRSSVEKKTLNHTLPLLLIQSREERYKLPRIQPLVLNPNMRVKFLNLQYFRMIKLSANREISLVNISYYNHSPLARDRGS